MSSFHSIGKVLVVTVCGVIPLGCDLPGTLVENVAPPSKERQERM